MWFFCTLAFLVSELFVCRANVDMVNIGPLFWQPTPGIYYYEPGARDPNGAWDQSLDPLLPSHGRVNYFYWRNNDTKAIRNCVRVVGGKNAFVFPLSKVRMGQQSRWVDAYYCHQGLTNSSSLETFATLRFSVFYNNYHRDTDPYVTRRLDPKFSNQFMDALIDAPSFKQLFTSRVASSALDLNTGPFNQWNTWVDQSAYIELAWARDSTNAFDACDLHNEISGAFLQEFEFVAGVGGVLSRAETAWCFSPYTTNVPNLRGVTCPISVRTFGRNDFRPVTADMLSDIAKGSLDAIHACLTENMGVGLSKDFDTRLADPDQDLWRNVIYLNFESNCVFMPDRISVACLDPSKYKELATDYATTGVARLDLFQAIQSIEWSNHVDILSRHVTHGYLQYQSWHTGMAIFLRATDRIHPTLRAGLGLPSVVDSPIPSQASIWSILFSHTISRDAFFKNIANDEWRLGWGPLLSRVNPTTNVFMMNCPVATKNNVGVNRTSPCNMAFDNYNSCNGQIGRCFCGPGWLGIACDIPDPGLPYDQLVADPSDPYEICSTAGSLEYDTGGFDYPTNWQTTTPFRNVRVCRCIQNFEGTPLDWKSWVSVYASLFHRDLLDRVHKIRAIPTRLLDTNNWFALHTHPSFDAAHNVFTVSGVPVGFPSKTLAVKFDWYRYVMTHQCLIWTQPAYVPPMNVWWDYFSAPYIYDTEPSEVSYQFERKRYPWPAISTTRRNATAEGRVNPVADGRQGIRCMDYRESASMKQLDYKDWSEFVSTANADLKEYTVGTFVMWLQQKAEFFNESGVETATLYGGPLCTPCPNCNRRNSICVAGPPVASQCECNPAVETCTAVVHNDPCQMLLPGFCKTCNPKCASRCTGTAQGLTGKYCIITTTKYFKTCYQPGPNFCQCDTNFCGPTCDIPMCPSTTTGNLCGNGTCVMDPTRKCENLAPGEYGGFCKCNPGYNGTACENAICPLSPTTGIMCSGHPCNEQLGQCECPDMTAGRACELKGCKRVNGSECAGATRADTGETVCNRETQECECYKTYQIQENDITKLGWANAVDSRILLNARWGRYCEFTFGDACRDPHDGSWCSQPITSTGSPIGVSEAYAACYNETCQFNPSLGIDTLMGGHVCKPYCHCTLKYAVPDNTYCRKYACGPQRCGQGECDVDCYRPGTRTIETACTTQDLLNGKLTMDAHCECKVVNGTYYYHKDPNPSALMACTDPAPLCYSGDTSPCNGKGECTYNATSNSFYCICDYGYSGQNCSVSPLCNAPTGEPCVGSTRSCQKDNNQEVCTCDVNYFRDANRTCSQERCVATLGRVGADGDCECPESRPIYSDPPLERIELNHRKLGCRKGCPFYESVPCGAVDLNGASRCSDLMLNDPIFWDDPRPAPNCSCFFRGKDHLNHTNYWVPDPDTGACKPKCYPEGLCTGTYCPSVGNTLNDDNSCNCAPGFEGENCTDHKCPPGQSHHMGDGVCMCNNWCLQGPNCKTDVCQASGGSCQPDVNPNDCVCPRPFLKLDSSKQLFHRNCTSACQNGGTLTLDRSACVCPYPYYGPVCELTQNCNPQWSGTFCNVSNCVGGTPLPQNQVGCTCSDTYYSGVLCDQDSCILANRRQRTPSGCVCASGYVGSDCSDPCIPGGALDPIAATCACKPGWTLAPNQTACLQPPTINCSFVGTVLTNIYGGEECLCPQQYSGSNCETPTCLPPFVSVGRNRCACPAGSYGPSCSENYCDSYAIGFNETLGLCVCPVGYRISETPDGSGTRQCEPDPFYCNMFGTRDWSNISNPLPCQCNADWTGTQCNSIVFTTQSDSSPVLSPVAVWSIGGGVVVVIILGIIMAVVWCRPTAPVSVATKSRHKKCMY